MRDVGSSDQRARASIPASALLLKDFVNTVDIAAGIDGLDTSASLASWAADHRLTPVVTPPSASDLSRVVDVREGIRQLLRINAGHDPAADVLERFNDALEKAPVVTRFSGAGDQEWTPVRRTGVTSTVAELLVAIDDAKQRGSWNRLKVCARDECQWAYYDTSRNRSGRWCSMVDCGNRVKMRRAYATRTARTNDR